MVYILIIFLLVAFSENKLIYILSEDMEYSIYNTLVVYLLNMLIPTLIYTKYGITSLSVSYFLLVPFIVIISIIDFHTSFVYDLIVVSGIILQGILFIFNDISKIYLLNHIEGLIIGMGLSFIMYKLRAIGDGDIGVYALCCFVMGADKSIDLFIMSFFITCIFAVVIILKNRSIDLKIKIPFTPFIFTATILVMLIQCDIIKIYFDIINSIV